MHGTKVTENCILRPQIANDDKNKIRHFWPCCHT